MFAMDEGLLQAYRRTMFLADTPKARLALRVGQRSVELDDLLSEPHVAPGIPDYRLVYLRPALREALRRSFAIASRRSTIPGFEWPPHVLPR